MKHAKNKRILSMLLAFVMLAALAIPVLPMEASAASTYSAISEYNSTTGDVFLGGKYIELGISKHGSFGTSAAPTKSGFHSSGQLGMIVDGDGWGMGKSPTTGDFFLPGTPEERYVLAYTYNGTSYEYRVADRCNEFTGTWKTAPSVRNASSGDTLKAVVTGVTTHNVVIELTYSFGVEDKFFRTDVKITNQGSKDISNVRFVRSFDPDQDVETKGSYHTYHKVVCNPNSAASASDKNYAMVVARGGVSLEAFFFIAFDNRAYASHGSSGDSLVPASIYSSAMWASSHSKPNYATDADIAMTTGSTNGYAYNDTYIALTFNLQTISAAKSESLQYYSSLSPTVKDSLDVILNPVAPVIEGVTGASLEHGYTSGGPSVSVKLADNHTASYQWYRNTTNSNSGGTKISGATSASYQVPLKHQTDTTEYYYCTVTATRKDNGLSASVTTDAVPVTYLTGEHSWVRTDSNEPGCGKPVTAYYACELCPATKEETIGGGDHDYAVTSQKEPTCELAGYSVSTCKKCGNTHTEVIPALGHDYQITAQREPSCTVEGYTVMTCSRCGHNKRPVEPPIGHDFGDDNICDRCGYRVDSHTHSLTERVVAATCTSMGYTQYTCDCGYSYRANYVEPKPHDWDEGTVTTPMTCTQNGVIVYQCRDCDAERTDVILAKHDWSETITVPATCTTDGYMKKVCRVCDQEETEVIPAGHTWTDVSVEREPDCENPGSKSCVCSVCGAAETFEIPKLGHNFVNGVCTRCGIGFIDVVVPSEHPIYGMYFEVDEILSDYGPEIIDEYGVMLDYNEGAQFNKVAVYLTQDGTMWRRCIAATGSNIQHATYVPYLSYGSDIKYTGLNSPWINTFSLRKNSDGIWCYDNYATIGVNLQDAYGNLLLSLYDIGQAGAQTRIFDDLDEMIAWLKDDTDPLVTVIGDNVVASGEEIELLVKVEGCPAVTSFGIDVDYGDSFELVSGQWLQEGVIRNYDTANNKGAMAFNGATAANGDLFKLVLRAKEDVCNWQDVKFHVIAKNGNEEILNQQVTHSVFAGGYTITFKDYDGSIVSQKQYALNAPVTEPNVEMIRPADNTYTYTFAGWDSEITACTGNKTYTAVYDQTYIDYTVTFEDWNGDVLQTRTYHYGDPVTAPAAPTKESDNTYTYTFAGWDSEVVACDGSKTYRAVFEAEYIDYTVVYKNYDGSIFATQTYHYGDRIVAPEVIPEKPEDARYTYTFVGWDKELAELCQGDDEYTAVFEAVQKYVLGDMNGDEDVNDADAMYLLMYTYFSTDYPIHQDADFNHDGVVTDADAVYLLMHVHFSDDYPLE